MPVKKDQTGSRRVEMEIVVPGSPEEVWHALATGAGNTAWFTTASIDERVGGEIRFDLGPNGGSAGEVTAWDPPRRFGYVEREWAEGAPPVATEITITARGGHQCVMRMVHSLFSSTDEWDDQLEGFEKGWASFFEVLRVYLAHFAGRPAASFVTARRVEGDGLTAWKRVTRQLGIDGADAGDRRALPATPEALDAVVTYVRQNDDERTVLLRIDSPGPGAALIGTWRTGESVHVGAHLFFYGEDAAARAAASERPWTERLAGACAPSHR